MRKTVISIAMAAAVVAAAGVAPAVAKNGPHVLTKTSTATRHLSTQVKTSSLGTAAFVTDRLAGANRFTTAVEVSKATFPDGTWGAPDNLPVETVFVANGLNFPDALATGPLAFGIGPILLVPATGTVPVAVKNEVARLQAANLAQPTGTGITVVAVGGTDVVSDAVVAQLQPAGNTAQRIQGANRYETAALVAEATNQSWIQYDGNGVSSVFLANGLGFADSLGGGGAAAGHRGALMLTSPTSLPAPTSAALSSINPVTVYLLGGSDVVSTNVENQVKALLPMATVTRLAGVNRFETANAISAALYGAPTDITMVNGLNFPDALAAAPFAGLYGMSTLLTSGKCVTAGTAAEATRLTSSVNVAIGGTDVVSDNALNLGVC